MAPRSVAGYHLLRKIGEGGMSAVYQSYDVAAARPVAVKLLADHLAGQPEFVGRFYREARLSRVLEHPNIVQGHASGFDPEVSKHYLVLEFIDGPNAHGALAQHGRLPVGMVVRLGIDIARALKFLHDQRYIHRDVKPDNILLHPDGTAKLADLGLAKRLDDEAQLTSIHQGVGTSYYMPYEQAVNANLVDGRSDLFALGATLYHLLTGEVPFHGATHDEVIREKAHNAFRPLRELNPHLPVELADLVAAMLNCDPRARIQTAGQLIDALTATRLASTLPAFAPTPPTPIGRDSSLPTDMSTRTDHRVSFTVPEQFPPQIRKSFTAGVRLSATHVPTAPSWNAWPWFITAGAMVLALVGHALRPGETPAPQPHKPAIAVQEGQPRPEGMLGNSSQ